MKDIPFSPSQEIPWVTLAMDQDMEEGQMCASCVPLSVTSQQCHHSGLSPLPLETCICHAQAGKARLSILLL
jgi:hypothetical protein